MSEEVSLWTKLTEKLLGLILIIISIVIFYLTSISTDALRNFAGLFGFLGAIVLIAGIFLVIAKAPE